VLRMLRDVAGIDQVLYGTDFPYLRRDLAMNSKQRILQSSELNDSESNPRPFDTTAENCWHRLVLGSAGSLVHPPCSKCPKEPFRQL
jgi:hypothetical protein